MKGNIVARISQWAFKQASQGEYTADVALAKGIFALIALVGMILLSYTNIKEQPE